MASGDCDRHACRALMLYRPFDVRWHLYHDAMVLADAADVMRHICRQPNVGLVR